MSPTGSWFTISCAQQRLAHRRGHLERGQLPVHARTRTRTSRRSSRAPSRSSARRSPTSTRSTRRTRWRRTTSSASRTADESVCGDPATLIHTCRATARRARWPDPRCRSRASSSATTRRPAEFGGFYVQEQDSDADAEPATSEGDLRLQHARRTSRSATASACAARSRSSQRTSSLTELTSVNSVSVCSTGNPVTPTTVTLPVERDERLRALRGHARALLADADRERDVHARPVRRGAPRRGRPALHADRGGDARRGGDRAGGPEPAAVVRPRRRQQPAEHRPDALSRRAASRRRTRSASGYTVDGLDGVFDERFSTYRVQPVGPGPVHRDEPADGRARRRRRQPQGRLVQRPQLLQRQRPRRRLPDVARREHAVRARPPEGEGGQRAAGDERRHRRPDGDRERRAAEQRDRGARRRPERRDGRRHVRVHQHRRDRHGRDQGRADLQAGERDAGRRVQDHHDRHRSALHRHEEPAVARADVPEELERREAHGRRQPPEVEGLRLQRRRRSRHRRRPGQLQPDAEERRRGDRRLARDRPDRAAATPTSC